MCRWGCPLVDSTYMCKWCGTRFCRECLLGDFAGKMLEPGQCRVCNQRYCQGRRVEFFQMQQPLDAPDSGSAARRPETAPGGSLSRASAKSATKSAASASAKSRKSAGKRASGKKKRKRTKTT